MFSALFKLLDQQRAFEVADFAIAFFLLLLVSLLFLLVLCLIRSRKFKRELFRRSEEVYYHLLPTFGLDAEEHEFVKRMADFLTFPQQMYRILINPQLFDVCADRLREKEDIDVELLASLRSKLGFSAVATSLLPISSIELPEGMPLLIVQKQTGKARGKVIANTAASLVVRMPQNNQILQSGVECTVFIQTQAGFFSFRSKIVSQAKQDIRLQHSDQIKRHQRRRHSRKKIRLPVFLNIVNGKPGSYASDLIDLSAGGASLRNPEKRLDPGNYVELSFSPRDEQFHVVARVVRVSQGGNLAHVVFESLDQGIRDRIAHSLL